MNKIYYFHLLLIALFTTVSLQAESVSVNANMPDTWAVLADTDTTQGVIIPPPAKSAAFPPPTTVCINEMDSNTPGTPDVAEYIELSGTPNGVLDHFVVVLFNGANDLSYRAYDLDGFSLDANGFFLIGNSGVAGVDLVIPNNTIQNGADAVAIYDTTSFVILSFTTTVNLVDAIVYDTDNADDTGLLTGLGQTVQYNENENGLVESQSISRSTDCGSTIVTQNLTPNASNGMSICPTFSGAPNNVSITNSTCGAACTPSGGSFAAPTCPAGSTPEYSTDGGTNWSGTLPTYAQSGPVQTIQTRCGCTSDNTMKSPASVGVTTDPAKGCQVITQIFNTPNILHDFTVPADVTALSISLIGADGGDGVSHSGGSGGAVSGNITVAPGQNLRIIVGQSGGDGGQSGGGGGGTAVISCGNPANCADGTLLFVAGGGGGAGVSNEPSGTGPGFGATNVAGAGNEGGFRGGGGTLLSPFPGTGAGAVASKTAISAGGSISGGSGFGGGGGRDSEFGGGGGGFTGGSLQYGGSNYVAPGATSVVNNSGNTAGSQDNNSNGVVTILYCQEIICPNFSQAPADVTVTNSTCTTTCGTIGGSFTAPTCPANTSVQYAIDNGPWQNTLPTYNFTTPQTIQTRCVCTVDATIFSAASVGVTTAPAGNCQGMSMSQSYTTAGFYEFIVPSGISTMTMEAIGAPGGNGAVAGGGGGSVTATFAVAPGDHLNIIVGAAGEGITGNYSSGGGGGGSAVINCANSVNCSTSTLLLVAGGGGGGSSDYFGSNGNASTGNGNGGSLGDLGTTSGISSGGGGGGINTDGDGGGRGGKKVLFTGTSAGGTGSGLGLGGSGFGGGGFGGEFSTGGGGGGYTGGNAGGAYYDDYYFEDIIFGGEGGSNYVAANAMGVSNNSGDSDTKANGSKVTLTFCQSPCPDLTSAPTGVTITNSTCNGDCTPSGGSFTAPACPTGSTPQYSTDGGANWSGTLPTYAQSGPAQTVRTRCSCTTTPTTVSPASADATTVPGTCTTAAYTISTAGNVLTVTDAVGNADVLTVTEDGTGIQFATTPARTYSLNGGPATCFPVTIPNLTSFTSATINAAGGTDEVSITGFTVAMPNFTVNGDAGDLTFNGNLTNNAASARSLALNSDANITLRQSAAGGLPINTNVVATGNVTINQLGYKTNGGTFSSSGVNITLQGNGLNTSRNGAPGGNVNFTHTGNVQIEDSGMQTGGGSFSSSGVYITVEGSGMNTSRTNEPGGNVILTPTGNVRIQGAGMQTGGGSFSSTGTDITIRGLNTSRSGFTGGSVMFTPTGNVLIDQAGLNTGGGSFSSTGGINLTIRDNGANTSRSGFAGGNVTLTPTGNVLINGVQTGGGSFSSTGVAFEVDGSGLTTSFSGGAGGNVTLTPTGVVQIKSIGIVTGGGNVSSSGTNLTITNSGMNTSLFGGAGGSVTLTPTGVVLIEQVGVQTGGGNFSSSGTSLTISGSGGLNTSRSGFMGGSVTLTTTGVVLIQQNVQTGGGNFSSSGTDFTLSLGSLSTSRSGFAGGNVTLTPTGNVQIESGGVQTGGGNFSSSGIAFTIIGGGMNTSRNGFTGGNITLTPTGNVLIEQSGVQTGGGNFSSTGGVDITIKSGGLNATTLGGTGTVTINHTGNALLPPGGGIQANGNISITASTLGISSAEINTTGGTVVLNTPNGTSPTFISTDVTGTGLSFAAGSKLNIVVNGTTQGDGMGGTYTQLKVIGTVNLTGTTLMLSGTHVPALGHTFTLVNNDGTDAITGTFNGLAEGAYVNAAPFSSLFAKISYMGGDGNDAVLTVVAADYTITSGADLTITDDAGNGDVLDVTPDGTGINFATSPQRTYALNGGATMFFPVTIASVANFNNITINTEEGDDTNNIGAFTAALNKLTINGGTGGDAVNFNGDITFASNADLDVDLQNDDATPGTDVVTVAANANLILSGTGTATVKVSKNVLVNNGGSIETADGDLTVEANHQAVPTSGNFKGVELNGGILDVNGTGNLTVKGEGGDAGTTFQNGVSLTAGGQIIGGTGGTVTVEGTGGNGAGLRNYGVYVEMANSAITSSGAPVNVTGVGNGTGAGSNRSHGVFVNNFGTISAGGMGAVKIDGTGGQGAGGANFGVVGAGSGQITSSGGPVTVVGNGGVGSTGSMGVLFQANASITSGGNGNVHVTGMSNGTSGNGNVGVNVNSFIGASGTGSTTVIGFGGAGTGTDNIGVRVVPSGNPMAMITSAGGPVSVTGTGGGTVASSFNYGVACGNGEISAGGTGSVTIMGTGGTGTGGFNFGVLLNNAATKIFTANGPIDITGLGGDGTNGAGVALGTGAVIEAGGTGTVQVLGTGGSTGPLTRGVSVETGAEISSTNGNVTVTGIAGGTGSSANNLGIAIVSNALSISSIHAGGTGTVTLNGTGGATSGDINWGVLVGTNSSVFTENGPVNITGQGGGAGASNGNSGVVLQNGGKVTGGGTHNVTIHGTGGNSSGAGNVGVVVQNPGTEVTSSGGDIHITGVEGMGSTPFGIGTYLTASVTTAAGGGDIFLTANSMKIEAPVSTDAGGSVTLKPLTAGVQIDLGAATDPAGGPLSLTDTELDLVTTGTLNIGNANTGDITVSASITRPTSTVINLTTGDEVNLDASALNSAGGNVNISAVGGVNPSATSIDVNAGGGILDFATGNDLNIPINGTTVDVDYRQLNVVGQVDITGVDLVFSGSYTPLECEVYTIVNNDGTDAIVGIFTGLAEGATLSNFRGSGLNAKISYVGGDGNDVVIKVTDVTPPTITCPDNRTVNTDPTLCRSVQTYTVTANDNCVVTTTTQTAGLPSSGAFPLNTTTNGFTVTDGAGLTATCSFSITVVDNQPPVITCPSNIVRTADANQCSAVVTYTVSASDNCSSVTTTRTNGQPSGSAFPVGFSVVNWLTTDINGNTTACSFSITVTDNQLPSIVCSSNVTKVADPGQCTASTTYPTPNFSDNCPGAYLTRTSGSASGAAFPVGIHSVNWQATDAGGNTAICNFTVTVSDTQMPSITCPANVVKNTAVGQCTAVVTYANPTATDNCNGVSAVLTSATGTASGSAFDKGATQVMWKVTDGVGLTKTCAFTVTVNDAQAPTITCPGNQVRSTDAGICTAVVNYTTPTFTDNCAGASVAIQSGLVSGSAFPRGITTVAWKATDGAGLTKTCTFRVTVNDAQAPTFTLCPSSQSVSTDAGLCTAAVTYATPTATDNCTLAPSVVKMSGLASGSNFPKGTSAVVWKATDGVSLTKTCSFTITVTDTQLPTITCPANIAVTAAPGQCNAMVTYANPTASDNCSSPTAFLLSGLASGANYSQGVTTNVWKATDNSGLTQTCAFTVTVSCGTAPETMNIERGTMNEQNAGEASFILHRLSFTLAPNPATTQVLVTVEGLGENGGELSLFDAQGRVVWQQSNILSPTSNINVADLPAGLYFVTLRSAGVLVTKRLVKAD